MTATKTRTWRLFFLSSISDHMTDGGKVTDAEIERLAGATSWSGERDALLAIVEGSCKVGDCRTGKKFVLLRIK